MKQVKYILIYAEIKAIRLQCGFYAGCVFNITEGFGCKNHQVIENVRSDFCPRSYGFWGISL